MTYNINMGCASSKISRRSRNLKIIEMPSFKIRKTRMSLGSISPLDSESFIALTEFVSNINITPILHIENNSLRNKRLQK